MSKLADAKEYGVDASKEAGGNLALAVAKGVLNGGGFEEIATAALGAVLNSYVPGLSGMLGLSGSGPDPAAAYAQAILNRIDAAEQSIKDEIDRFWDEARQDRNIDIQTDYASLVSDLHAWQTEYTQWGQLALPDLYTDSLSDMRHFIEWASLEIAREGTSDDGYRSYPYLHHLETLAEVVQLQLLHAPKHAYIVAAQGMGVHDYPSYQQAGASTLAQIDAMAAPKALAAIENAVQPAFELADTLSAIDPFKKRVDWMFAASPKIDWSCNTYDTEAKIREHGLRPVAVGFDGWDPVRYTVRREKEPGQRTEETHDYCILAAIADGGDSTDQVYLSTYDGMIRVFKTRQEALQAHRRGMYNMLLRVGWGPFRVFLDRWWNVLRAHGLRFGDRPYLALDKQLDAYLADGESAPLQAVLDALRGNTVDGDKLTPERRSKFVGYAMQYGDLSVLKLLFAAGGYDPLAPLGEYPLAIHEQFVNQSSRNPENVKTFYSGQFAAKFVALR